MAPDRPLVEAALELLTAKYVFPDRAKDAAAAIRDRLAAGEYDGLDESSLAERLTGELFALCGDKHLRVRVREEGMHDQLTDAELTTAYREQSRLGNYGIAQVRRLDGNVGYLDLHGVADPVVAGRAIGAAMELVAHTHALIVDLRKNRGGTPDGVQLWHSHLFPDSDTHLNDIFHADTGETRQYWTLANVPGPRYLDRPVYLLTSAFTFSAGEEFAYNLKALRRATLIGETTRGGAHPTDVFPFTPTLEITVPVARSVNPITGTNWEGTGAEPDVVVPADEAFDVAYRTALEHVLTVDASPAVLAEARAALKC